MQRVACENVSAHEEKTSQEALEWPMNYCRLLGTGHDNEIYRSSSCCGDIAHWANFDVVFIIQGQCWCSILGIIKAWLL